MKPTILEKTFAHLEWPRVLTRLAEHCRGPVAARLARELDFADSLEALKRRHALTTEARALVDASTVPPLGQPPDIARPVRTAARGSVLEAEELAAIGQHLETAARCRRYLSDVAERIPHLYGLVSELADLPDLGRALMDSFDEHGDLADSASGDLGHLRTRVTALHGQLKERVSNLLSEPDYEDLLQDEFYTIREDRYVLPVKAGHKRHIEGIVHGWSASGATVYIEPQAVVEANNKLLLAQAEVDREVRRILAKLSRDVGKHAATLDRSVSALERLDLAMACGHLSRELEGSEPEVGEGGELRLKRARHPLLLLSGLKVVPNDLVLGEHRKLLVITGPNTGGKTVALKTVGLSALMALSGLHVPAAHGSRVPFVPGVFSDIGDEQSLDRSHSTFSGHIANIRSIFEEMHRGSLVLLDELVVGTDPLQGAALAQAIVEGFADRGAFVVVTTHYESLKALPFEDARFRNGAMGFDPESRTPNYRLELDVPGTSSALQTAKRLGLPAAIVDRATHLSGPEQRRLEQIVQKLEGELSAARRDREAAAEERRKTHLALAEAEAIEARLKERMKNDVERERDAALLEAKRLRQELSTLKKSLSEETKRKDPKWVEQQRSKVELAIEKVHAAKAADRVEAAGPPLDASKLKVGQRVQVVSLGGEAILLSLPDARGRVEVRAGIATARTTVDDLRPAGPLPPAPKQVKAPKPEPERVRDEGAPTESDWQDASPQAPDTTVDVRGMRAEEAQERVASFLDNLYGRNQTCGYIIHGHGTGALKASLRSWLPSCSYVWGIRPGGRYEGGDGVTAVLLR